MEYFFNSNRIFLFLVPFLLILFGGWILGAVPEKSAVGKFFDALTEKDLPLLMRENGFDRMDVRVFLLGRIFFSFLFSYLFLNVLMGKGNGISGVFLFFLLILAVYKGFYFYLCWLDRKRIQRLNTVLPYMMKSVSYLATVYPVNNALLKSLEIIPEDFKGDIRLLCEEIDKDPVSFSPYQKILDRYDGKLSRLDYYFKTLYRMSMSASKEESKLLSGLNSTISEEMSAARKQKNEIVNSTISYLGLIPVGLLTAMLVYLMMNVLNAL